MWEKNAILTVVLFCLFVKINGQGEQCYSPSGAYGICVVLPQCPSLVYYYGQSQGNRQVINYLLAAQRNCGTRRIGDNPIVCCDNPVINPVQTERPYQPQPATTQTPYQPQPEYPPEEPISQPPVVTQRPTQPPTRYTTPQTTTVAPTQPATDPRNAGKSCKDPNGVKGYCINIKECPSILNKFIEKSNDPRYIRYIKASNSFCGNVQAVICCPFDEKNEVPSTTESVIIPNEPIEPIKPVETIGTPNGTSIQGRLLTVEEGCGYSKEFKGRIVGGKAAKPGAYPWMALLGYENNFGERSWKCGGSLITTRHVLSAAHCAISTLSLARLGEHDISSSNEAEIQDIKITRAVKHPDYDKRDGTSDIAVLYLEHDAQLSLRVTPICIPINDPIRSKDFTHYRPFVSGWGRLLEGGKSSNVLQELEIEVHENDVCRDRYQKQGKLLSNKQFGNKVLCAGFLEGGRDSCQGDSGGPLAQPINTMEDRWNFYQIGVVSYGIGCARAEIPGVYTSVQHFADWIQERVNE